MSNLIDTDGDGISDCEDNCIDEPNTGQADKDNDGIGDKCDNCPDKKNSGQKDSDGNGVGDACEVASLLGQDHGSDGLLNLPNVLERLSLKVFPNPFMDQLSIETVIPQDGRLSITVFNLQGQQVRDLFTGQVFEGEQLRFRWDGSDNSGMQLPSGMYLIQLQTGKERTHQKVLLQR